MLLNIVRSRYQEMPVFLEVSSVVAQYSYDRSVGVTGIREDLSPGPTTTTGIGNVNLGFSEFPTISYTPLAGEAFAKHLYSEVPADIFFAAAQAGWAIDVLMAIGLHRFGTSENMSFGEVRSKMQREADVKNLERFSRTIELLFVLSDQRVIEVQQATADEEAGTKSESYLIIAEEVPYHLRPLLAELRQLIGITNANRFRITRQLTNVKDDEITIQTRSVMAMIKFLARGVEIPHEYLEQGWVIDYGLQTFEGAEELFPFKMHSSSNRPKNAFASVRYQDYWYYINNDDIVSKRALEHIMILFQLKAPQSESSAPLLTLPTR